MKRLLSLLLLLSVVGSAVADIGPERRLGRPVVNLPQESVNQIVWLAPYARVMLPFFAPSFWPVQPRFSAPREIIPIPPVCDLSCLVRPVRGVAE